MLNRIERFVKRSDFFSFLDRNCLRRPYFQIIEKSFLELKRVETLSLDEKVELQKQKMLALLNHAQASCPYYNEVFKKRKIDIRSLDHLSQIPFLTKEIVRKHGPEMVSRKTKRIFLIKRNTGGSTGEPLGFYSDPDACAIDLAHHKFLYDLMGHVPGDIIAGGAGISVPKNHRNKNIYWVEGSKYGIEDYLEIKYVCMGVTAA